MFMNRFVLRVLASLFLAACPGFAQGVPEDVVKSIEQEQLRRQQRDWDFNAEPDKRPDIHLERPGDGPDDREEDPGPCFPVSTTRVEGAEDLDLVPPDADRLNGTCVRQGDLSRYLDSMNAFYAGRGWITTRVYLPEQDLSGGTLRVLVIPGRIEDFDYEGGQAADSRIHSAFPSGQGDIVNLRDIEQALENFNAPPTQSGTFKLYPGTRHGTSIVRISPQNRFPLGGRLSLDNLGYRNTGRYKTGADVHYDNLLNRNDTLRLGVSSTTRGLSGGKTYARDVHGRYLIPFGNWGLHIGAGYNTYRFTLPGINQRFPLHGYNHRLSADLQRLLWRGQAAKVYGVVGAGLSRSRNYLGDHEVLVQRRFATKAKVGLNGRTHFAGGYHSWSVNAIRGMDAMGARRPLNPALDPEPFLVTGTSAVHARFMDGLLRLDHQIRGQYSRSALSSSDRFSLGGGSFGIRGFQENSLSGSKGVSTRNDLAIRLHQDPDTQVAFVLGLDGGSVTLSADDHRTYGQSVLVGASAGVRLSLFSRLHLDLTVARALERPASFTDPGTVKYVQMALSF